MAKKKVFISWSGKRSREIAKRFGVLLQCTIQAIEPWHSDENLEKGTTWFSEIFKSLKDTNIGIICLTKENKDNPWILFESGAIAKGLESSRVYTLLIDLNPTDVKLPLSNFNHTELSNKDSVYKLFKSINDQLEDEKLDTPILQNVFKLNWPSFEEAYTKIIQDTENTASSENDQTRSDRNILEEILSTVREINKKTLKTRPSFRDYLETNSHIDYELLEEKVLSNVIKKLSNMKEQEQGQSIRYRR